MHHAILHHSLALLLLAALALTSCGDGSSGRPEPPEQRLVSVSWLDEHRDEVVILDARPSHEYAEGHIPGAISLSFAPEDATSNGVYVSYGGGLDLWVDTDNPVPFQDASPEEVQEAVRALGISDDSKVVIYDAGAHFHAARAFFTLHYHGLRHVQLLNGGIGKWESVGKATSTEVPQVEPGNFYARVEDPRLKVDTDDVLEAISDPERQLVHSLPPAWHYGSYLAYSRAGHIPSTKMIPLGYFFNSDGTWKSPQTLRVLFEAQGIDLDRQIITYCGGNPLSACTFFTAKFVAGAEDVRNYHGSVTAWLEDPRDLPLDHYQHPNMLRDTDWIHWFAGDRIQHLLLDAPAVVVDVRSEQEYDAGHIPWSVNVPMGGADEALGVTRTQWADRLGAAGVGGPIEAVVCDEGLTPRAAAMFFVLEHLGHRDVSLCADGISGWEALHALTQEETLIASPEHRIDVAIHPQELEPQPTDRVVTSLTDEGREGFPRLWVVTSEEIPEALAGADVVHVPAAAHLDASGRILSAGALWALYEGEGLQLFGDVAIHGDDWQQASIAYVALRLLGLPMVKVYLPEDAALTQ